MTAIDPATQHVPFLGAGDGAYVAWADDNSFSFTCRLARGLYTVGLQADLKEFDWERLWMPMTKYGNIGQRTGPWDFDLYNDNVPLIPAWKIVRNDRFVGLFYLQRPTIEDLDRRTLRGEFGFYLPEDGEVRFRAEPLNDATLRPIAMYIEPNLFDQFAQQAWAERGLEANWAHHIARVPGWAAIRKKVEGTEWETALKKGCDAFLKRHTPKDGAGVRAARAPAAALMLLAFTGKVFNAESLIEATLESTRYFLDLPAWGNPNPLGYGHNGDMGCALIIKHLSVVYNWLHDELGDLRPILLARLEKQLAIFFEQQLLMAQYWGGATLQDHGYRSSPNVGFAAINLLGHSEYAKEVLAFYIPRFRRTIEKQPYDGFIPFTQYHKIQLHVNDMLDFRNAYKFASGEDAFRITPAFANVPKYILSCLDEKSMTTQVCVTRGDRKEFAVGLPFFFALAKDFGCEHSRYLAGLLMKHSLSADPAGIASGSAPGHDTRFVWASCETLPMAVLEVEEGLTSDARPDAQALQHFPDGGALQYRDDAHRFNVAVMCNANTSSFHAMASDLSGTDMGISNPSLGMFSVAVGGEPLIQCAESGYRTGTRLGNVLLIDGKGQVGDNGYAMGVPMRRWHGARIQKVLPDKNGGGSARINLAPAYPEDLGVMTYTRDFFFEPTRVTVRDTVITLDPHDFSYWFNTWKTHALDRRTDGTWLIAGSGQAVRFAVTGNGWSITQAETDVVWAYGNEQNDHPFVHLEVAIKRVRAFTVEFLIALAE